MSANQSGTSSPQVRSSKHSSPFLGGGSGSGGGGSSGRGSPSVSAGLFTTEMRSRQARGKDPYRSDSEEEEEWFLGKTVNDDGVMSNVAVPPRHPVPIRDSTFTANERRRLASQVLNNPELLAMAAIRDNESIPATRLRYTRLLCGFEEPNHTNNNYNNGSNTNPQTRSSSSSGRPSGSDTPLSKRAQRRRSTSFREP